jgi:hypothetical protein
VLKKPELSPSPPKSVATIRGKNGSYIDEKPPVSLHFHLIMGICSKGSTLKRDPPYVCLPFRPVMGVNVFK